MKLADRAILLSILMVGLLVVFYFMLLSPKRKEASKLNEEIVTLQSSIDGQAEVVAFAEQARKEFPRHYSQVVVLGKAVPDQADTSSMLVQLSSISERTKVEFEGIALGEGGAAAGAAAPAAPPAESEPPAEGSTETPAAESSVPTEGAPSATDVPAPATEATAANLPIGSSVGPAGLATLPYKLSFAGTYFDVADFLTSVDALVHAREGGRVLSNGRLLTIDGFALKGGKPGSSPELGANFALTSYVTPAGQSLTLGATPGGPAPASPAQPQTTPASTVTP